MAHPPQEPVPALAPDRRYWRSARRLIASLLGAWFLVTFGVLYFARELSHISLFGWPFSFYMAGQGLTLFYFVLVAIYVLAMRHLDNVFRDSRDHAK